MNERTEDHSDRVCVIGAGPAGIAAGKHLHRAGLRFDMVDANPGFGGLWNWREDSSPAYSSTHLITSKTVTAFPDFPMPASYPDFPHADLVRAYLASYAEHCGLGGAEFATRVLEVRRTDRGGSGWIVRAGHPDGEWTRDYRAVLVCAGHLSAPRLPEIPGAFTGEQFHSIAYKTPGILEGKRVLVVGAGNTGCDIAVEAGRVGAFAALSMRRGYHYVPKYLFGRPIDIAVPLPLSLRRRRPIDRLLLRLAVGDPSRLGIPKPDHRLYERIPIVSSELLYSLGHGRIVVRPEIARLDGGRVHFTDGTAEPYDLLVYATGYRASLGFLPDGLVRFAGHKPDLFMNIFPRDAEDIAMIGLTEVPAGGWEVEDVQAELAVRSLASSLRGEPASARFGAVARRPEPDLSGGLDLCDPLHYDTAPFLRHMRRLIATFP